MHIFVIASWYPSLERPLNGVFFQEQAELMRKAGHQVGVLGLNNVPGRSLLGKVCHRIGSIPMRLQQGQSTSIDDVVINRTFWCVERLALFQFFRKKGLRRFFQTYVDEYGLPDVIHVQSCLPGVMYADDLSTEFGIPWFVTEHSSAFMMERITQAERQVLSKLLSKAAAITAVSDALAGELAKLCPERTVEHLPNAIDTDYFTPCLGSEPGFKGVTFFALGFLNANKNFGTLIKAFAEAFPAADDVTLVLGGSGEEEASLRGIISDLGQEARIRMLGKMKRDEVRHQMRSASVVVSSSVVETFGITLIEAMACGKPVLSTKSGGPESFITPDTGILVEQGNFEALVRGLQYIKANLQRYDTNVIRQYAVKYYSGEAYVRHVERVCSQIHLPLKKPLLTG